MNIVGDDVRRRWPHHKHRPHGAPHSPAMTACCSSFNTLQPRHRISSAHAAYHLVCFADPTAGPCWPCARSGAGPRACAHRRARPAQPLQRDDSYPHDAAAVAADGRMGRHHEPTFFFSPARGVSSAGRACFNAPVGTAHILLPSRCKSQVIPINLAT